MRILSSFLLFLSLLSQLSFSASKRPVDVLLYGHGIGDSKALQQIIKELKKTNLSYTVVASGEGIKVLEEQKDIHTLKWGSLKKKADPLRSSEIEYLKQQWKPRIVLTGMSSVAQAEVLNAFPKAKRVILYDKFEDPRNISSLKPFLKTVGSVDVCLVPSQSLIPSFEVLFKGTQIEVVGHPALKEWENVFFNIDRSKLRQKLGIEPTQKVVVFFGGRGEGYQESLDLFCNAVKNHSGWKVLVVPYPAEDGWTEKKAVGHKSHMSVEMGYALPELASIADAVVCPRLSVCPMVFLMGVPCVYLESKDYSDSFIERGWIERLQTKAQLEQWLIGALEEKPEPWTTRRNRIQNFAQGEIPAAPSAQIIASILEGLTAPEIRLAPAVVTPEAEDGPTVLVVKSKTFKREK
ncbi:MAG: hypothetical protein ACK5PQ_00870 [Alphaproteobacteria bacterium]